MKIYILIVGLLFSSFIYSQNDFKEAISCFDKGDYVCAQSKYKKLFRNADIKNQLKIDIKLKVLDWFLEKLKTANDGFDLENYSGAKKIYQEILSANPSDLFAKNQIKKCDKFTEPRLSITPNSLIFPSDASTNTINIETNLNSFSVSELPNWCTVIKQKDYIRVSCDKNKRRKARSGSFQIKSGPNLRTVDITQMGKGKKSK
tara:strand:+ start:161 stop:769 length:609 start_codon:yes stop_codon:yes gene_type:complete